MFKLLVKYILIIALFIAVIAVATNKLVHDSWNKDARRFLQKSYAGVFYQLTQAIRGHPSNQWQKIIDKLTPNFGNRVTIIPLSQLDISQKQLSRLHNGKVIAVSDRVIYYFMQFDNITHVYKLIPNTQYVLQMQDGITFTEIAKKGTAWLTKLVDLSLSKISHHQRREQLALLEKKYLVPMHLYSIQSNQLPKTIIKQVVKHKIAWSKPSLDRQIEYTFVWLPKTKQILAFGPFKSNFFNYDILYLVVIALIAIAMAFILFIVFYTVEIWTKYLA